MGIVMTILFKIFGNFRWLFLLIGITATALIAWALWPKEKVQEQSTVKIISVVDSAAIHRLEDSLSLLRASQLSVRIRRVTTHDTLGNSVITLDSGAIKSDTIYLTRVSKDTTYVHLSDSSKIIKTSVQASKRPKELRVETYTDRSLKTGFEATLAIPVGKILTARSYVDYQDKNFEVGLGAGMDWKIFTASGFVKNYGFNKNEFDFEIRGGLILSF